MSKVRQQTESVSSAVSSAEEITDEFGETIQSGRKRAANSPNTQKKQKKNKHSQGETTGSQPKEQVVNINSKTKESRGGGGGRK